MEAEFVGAEKALGEFRGWRGKEKEEFLMVACQGSEEVVVWRAQGWKEVVRL